MWGEISHQRRDVVVVREQDRDRAKVSGDLGNVPFTDSMRDNERKSLLSTIRVILAPRFLYYHRRRPHRGECTTARWDGYITALEIGLLGGRLVCSLGEYILVHHLPVVVSSSLLAMSFGEDVTELRLPTLRVSSDSLFRAFSSILL
jgi:hypothetical protein